jgi:uncharacterized membrane protein YfcA
MSAVALLLAVLVGGAVGVTSGLFGIGGGILMVPFLYYLMGGTSWSGLSAPLEYQAALAHATSLTVIVPTALSGLFAFRRKRAIEWSTVVPLGSAAAVAALLGSLAGAWLPTSALKTIFGVLVLATGIRIVGGGPSFPDGETGRRDMPWWIAVVAGGAVGFVGALLGVGGGVVAIPILLRWAKMDIRAVAPASIGIIVFAAPAGVLGYIMAGSSLEGMPAGSLGFAYLPAAVAMAPGAVALAPLGARWNQRMGSGVLRSLFAAFLLLVGADLVWTNGVRTLLGL